MRLFMNRREAGMLLAEQLIHYGSRENVVVLALPRGGVPVGYEVAGALRSPLDVLIIRKIGCPGNPELAAGAVSETGVEVYNEDVLAMYRIPREYLVTEVKRQREEIARRAVRYRSGKGLIALTGKIVILVDDGVATGATMNASIATLREEPLQKLVVALPVAPPSTAEEIRRTVDEWICVQTPERFGAVGNFYADFSQVSDEEVIRLLREADRNYRETAGDLP
ncbi:MAG: phosphoribosyltransferase [Desulfuromonadales bacterium]|nr:phosphoribosyltransferase [Desulfuromonadales bacterium]